MKPLSETIKNNLRAELQMAQIKRGELVRSGLSTRLIDERIDVLNARMRQIESALHQRSDKHEGTN